MIIIIIYDDDDDDKKDCIKRTDLDVSMNHFLNGGVPTRNPPTWWGFLVLRDIQGVVYFRTSILPVHLGLHQRTSDIPGSRTKCAHISETTSQRHHHYKHAGRHLRTRYIKEGMTSMTCRYLRQLLSSLSKLSHVQCSFPSSLYCFDAGGGFARGIPPKQPPFYGGNLVMGCKVWKSSHLYRVVFNN